MIIDYMNTPIGTIEIQASDNGINQLIFTEKIQPKQGSHRLIEQCKQQLQEYFNQERTNFDLPLDIGGTPFQNSIWNALINIHFGQVISYKDLAHIINKPKAIRAVGAANSRNPISIIIPCHRVIGQNGSLTGYAWGLERKSWLLKHERS
ncbi:cysteine methyltransferase [Candidatus Endobugula sertula]|uniref:Methylated-DNA--protein-cysteine methyltransferase n=1 Tax=Candidatus Endobugula sertula TaxID=62101 RepID=A0A1D2QTJ1_9GAMM|nr:cysteine methyltransferase [Candidatus Endobugula sertula]